MNEPIETLPAEGVVSGLSSDDLSELFHYGELLNLKKGDKIVAQGEPHAYLHLVLKGELRVATTSDEAILTLGYVQPGECVGEMSLLEPVQSAGANVLASADSVVWCLQREGFDRFIKEHPAAGGELLRGLAIQLCRRLRKQTQQTQQALSA